MKSSAFAAIVLLAFAPLLGCDGTYTQIENGQPGYLPVTQDTCLVARDATAAVFLHAWIHRGQGNVAAVSSIDFQQDILVAALTPPRSHLGHKLDVAGVTFGTSDMTVAAQETPPPPGFLGPAIQPSWMGPWVLVKITRHDGSVRLIKDGGTAIPAKEKTYASLAKDEYKIRKQAYLAQNVAWPAAPFSHLAALGAHTCPLDGAPLVKATLPADGSYTDLGNEGWFCPSDAQYWIYHTQGAFVGTVSYWWGPFVPGSY